MTVTAALAASPDDPLMLPVEWVAKLLGDVSVRTVERMVKRNEFPPPRKLGRRSLWPRALVERWVNDPSAVTAAVAPPVEIEPASEPMLLNDPKRTPPDEAASTPPPVAPPVVRGAASAPLATQTLPAPDLAAHRVVGEILAAVLATRPNPTPGPTPNPVTPAPAVVKPVPPPPPPALSPTAMTRRLPSPPVVRLATVSPGATVSPVPRSHPGSVPHPAAVAPSRLGTVPNPVRPPVGQVPPRPATPAPIPSQGVPNRPDPTRR